jgi:IS66 C-terminal element
VKIDAIFTRDFPDSGFDLHVAGLQRCRDSSITAGCGYRRLWIHFSERRVWLFAQTQQGARASANLYSLVSCARVNGVEPYAYLRYLFEELPKAPPLRHLKSCCPGTSNQFFGSKARPRLNRPNQ